MSTHAAPTTRTSTHPNLARAHASSHRTQLRLRARRIRRAVAAFALALFSAAFLAVYVQLASGHDPALRAEAVKSSQRAASEDRSRNGNAATTRSTGAGSQTSSEAETSGSNAQASGNSASRSGSGASEESSSATAPGEESGSGLGAVTTAQS